MTAANKITKSTAIKHSTVFFEGFLYHFHTPLPIPKVFFHEKARWSQNMYEYVHQREKNETRYDI